MSKKRATNKRQRPADTTTDAAESTAGPTTAVQGDTAGVNDESSDSVGTPSPPSTIEPNDPPRLKALIQLTRNVEDLALEYMGPDVFTREQFSWDRDIFIGLLSTIGCRMLFKQTCIEPDPAVRATLTSQLAIMTSLHQEATKQGNTDAYNNDNFENQRNWFFGAAEGHLRAAASSVPLWMQMAVLIDACQDVRWDRMEIC